MAPATLTEAPCRGVTPLTYTTTCWFQSETGDPVLKTVSATFPTRAAALDHIAEQWEDFRFVRAELSTVETFGVIG